MTYEATREDDGTLTVHRVPIFVECQRGEIHFDAQWIEKAVAKAKQAEREGYLPPLHIRHHEASTEANNSVRAAGYFRVLGVEHITFKGSPRLAIMADLIVTDPQTQVEILQKRLPYRSVEIFNVEKPAIDGLALLDHEAPFLELPMLMVSKVAGSTARGDMVSGETFGDPWSMHASTDAATPMVACFRRGREAHLLFREDDAMDDDKKKDDDTKDGDKGEKMEALDVGSIVKAIKSGSISVADMDAIVAAIQEQESSSKSEAEPKADDTPAPAATPGGESMKKQPTPMSESMAALAGENEALKARVQAIEAADLRKTEVAAAMKRLEGRPLGSDLEARLVKFHADHGAAAFKSYVDGMAQSIAPTPAKDGAAERFAAQNGGKVPQVAMKYQTAGADAVEKAIQFCVEWRQLHRRGHTRMSEERYVALNMERIAASTAAVE